MNAPNEKNQELLEKLDSYVKAHQRIITEFRTSLENAANFIQLAGVAREAEPEETQGMLDQIQEIDIYGNLNKQFELFQQIRKVVAPVTSHTQGVPQAELENLQEIYEELLDKALDQQEAIEDLMKALRQQLNPA